MSHDTPPKVQYAPNGSVVIHKDGEDWILPLAKGSFGPGGVDVATLSAFPPKEVQGDFTRADHLILSSYVQSSWIGGGQVDDADEAVHQQRYAGLATLETRYPQKLTLLPLTEKIVVADTTTCHPLGVLSDTFYAAFDTDIYSVTGTTATDTEDDLTATPTAKGVRFSGSGSVALYIPLGGNGYDVYDGSDVTNEAGFEPINLVVWDRKLWGVQADGEVAFSLDGKTWTTVLTADTGEAMRGLVVFYDRAESPALNLVTNRAIYAIDPAAPALYETEARHPAHPNTAQGTGFARWRADLWTAAGIGVYRYTFGTFTAAGPDRDDSLPESYLGTIVDLEPEHNALLALLKGKQDAGEALSVLELDLEIETQALLAGTQGPSALLRLDGIGGWHTAWVSESVGGAPTWTVVSDTTADYAAWWGFDGKLYRQALPRAFANPKKNPAVRFERRGRLESSVLDFQKGGSKLALAAIEVRTKDCTETETVRVQYQTDRDRDAWETLGTITSDGLHVLRIGANGMLPDGQTRYDGHTCRWVRYALDLERDPNDESKSPLVESVGIVFMTVPDKLRSFTFTVDCTSGYEDFYGHSPRQIQDFLDGLLDFGEKDEEHAGFFPFLHRDRWVMVRATGVSGFDNAGLDLRGDRRVSVVEVWETD